MPKRVRSGEQYLLAPGEWLPGKEQYQIQNFLGQGAFAAAYRAHNERGEVCFVKEYFPATRPSQVSELTRVYATERDVVRRIGNYELIPRFWDAFQHEGYSYLVTDFIPGPDVETVLKGNQKPDLDTLLRWSVCLCHELSFLHSRNVVHHDLKPDNIRLNPDGDPVIVDFSAAHWYRKEGETTDQLYGSDSFLAPEYAERSVEDAESGKKMDVFAMGRILIELMVGKRLSQEDIDRRQEALYGEIMHSGKVDVSFLRAVFKAANYNPAQRYASGVEMAQDITPAAAPVGRVRPNVVDFGVVEDGSPREVNIQCYNVGGGTLQAQLQADGGWLEVGTEGTALGPGAAFARNRQTIRVVAYPDRIQPGTEAGGRLLFSFNPGNEKTEHYLEVPVRLRRAVQSAAVTIDPGQIRLALSAGGSGSAKVRLTNQGPAPANVCFYSPTGMHVSVFPDQFVLAPHARQEITISVEGAAADGELSFGLPWTVEGTPRPEIPVTASSKKAGILALFKKK
jgi:hypothetical protein